MYCGVVAPLYFSRIYRVNVTMQKVCFWLYFAWSSVDHYAKGGDVDCEQSGIDIRYNSFWIPNTFAIGIVWLFFLCRAQHIIHSSIVASLRSRFGVRSPEVISLFVFVLAAAKNRRGQWTQKPMRRLVVTLWWAFLCHCTLHTNTQAAEDLRSRTRAVWSSSLTNGA